MMFAFVTLTACGGSTASLSIASKPVVEAASLSKASQWMPSDDVASLAWHKDNPNVTCTSQLVNGASKAAAIANKPAHKDDVDPRDEDDLNLRRLDGTSASKPACKAEAAPAVDKADLAPNSNDNMTSLSAEHWRPTTNDLPMVVLTLMLTWFFIGWTLKRRKSAEDVLFEKQRLQLAMDRLAQVHEQPLCAAAQPLARPLAHETTAPRPPFATASGVL